MKTKSSGRAKGSAVPPTTQPRAGKAAQAAKPVECATVAPSPAPPVEIDILKLETLVAEVRALFLWHGLLIQDCTENTHMEQTALGVWNLGNRVCDDLEASWKVAWQISSPTRDQDTPHARLLDAVSDMEPLVREVRAMHEACCALLEQAFHCHGDDRVAAGMSDAMWRLFEALQANFHAIHAASSDVWKGQGRKAIAA